MHQDLDHVMYLAHELGADVLHRVLQLHLPGDRDTVVHDLGAAVLLLQHHVAALQRFDAFRRSVEPGVRPGMAAPQRRALPPRLHGGADRMPMHHSGAAKLRPLAAAQERRRSAVVCAVLLLSQALLLSASVCISCMQPHACGRGAHLGAGPSCLGVRRL